MPVTKKNNKEMVMGMRNRVMNTYIRGIKNIKNAFVLLEDNILSIETDGTNMEELIVLPDPEIKTILCNEPFDVANTLGIEAARNTLFSEIYKVLSFDGTYVNIRHYQVLIDWMTQLGEIIATTRHGVSKYSKKSPIARATFEQPVEICLNAAIDNITDNLNGISEQLLIGSNAEIGTQTVKTLIKDEYQKLLDKTKEEEEEEEDCWIIDDTNQMTNQTINDPWVGGGGFNYNTTMGKMPNQMIQNTPIQGIPMWAKPSAPQINTQPSWDVNSSEWETPQNEHANITSTDRIIRMVRRKSIQ